MWMCARPLYGGSPPLYSLCLIYYGPNQLHTCVWVRRWTDACGMCGEPSKFLAYECNAMLCYGLKTERWMDGIDGEFEVDPPRAREESSAVYFFLWRRDGK